MDNRTFIEFSSQASYLCYSNDFCVEKCEISSNHSQAVTQPIFRTLLVFSFHLPFSTTTLSHYLRNNAILTNKQANTHSKETTTIQSGSHPELSSRTKRQTGNPAEHKRSCNPSFSPESCSESLWPASD